MSIEGAREFSGIFAEPQESSGQCGQSHVEGVVQLLEVETGGDSLLQHLLCSFQGSAGRAAVWKTTIRKLKGHPINPSLSVTETRLTVVTDSSGQGAFGYELSDKYKVVLRQSFTDEEKEASSTERETGVRSVFWVQRKEY